MTTKGIEFHRGYEKGWQVATVYGRHPRGVLKFHLCRNMDEPNLWEIEPKPMDSDDDREDVVRDIIDSNELRGPYGSLKAAKQRLREVVEDIPLLGAAR